MSRISSSPNSPNGQLHWNQLYLGLGLTTLGALILELSLTRIFSVVFYYHFAFLAISVALFGLGAGGVLSYVIAARGGNLFYKLGILALADAACVVFSLWIILSRPADLGTGSLTAVYLASALPFFLAGAVVSSVITEAVERIDRAYFWDLAGAAGGCLLLIPFLNTFGGPNTVISAGVFFAAASSIWFHQAGQLRGRAIGVAAALALVMLMIANGKMHLLDVRVSKGMNLPPETFSAWNSFSRVGVTTDRGYLSVVIDGDAATAIATYDWDKLDEAARRDLARQGPALPYVLRPSAKTLIIGAGGGYDVARAFASGSKDISAVEINPIIANKIMRDRFTKESHRLYLRPEVRVFVEDGRSFVRRSSENYQVLQATLVDTWASTAAGAFALSENNLYTSDAFYDYLSHLTPDGVMTFTRWGFDPPRESLRLLSLARDAFARVGETDPASHVIVVRDDSSKLYGWGAQDTVLISRKAFSASDVQNTRQWLKESGLLEVYLPGTSIDNPFGQLLKTNDTQSFFDNYAFDVKPLDDDRPFFFYTVQPRDLRAFLTSANTESADYKINRAVPLLFGLAGLSIAATLVILFLPRLVLGVRLPKQKGVALFLLYFVCLGAGYILIQIALIQKFVLLLGHPTYALTVIVFSMLVASGLGSFFSKRVIASQDSRLRGVLALVAAAVAVLAFVAPALSQGAAAWPLALKMLLTAVAIMPAAFLMGMPFPIGLARLEAAHGPAVRWAWAANAASSVLGSSAAIILAIYFGLRATILIGGALYLIALILVWLTPRMKTA